MFILTNLEYNSEYGRWSASAMRVNVVASKKFHSSNSLAHFNGDIWHLCFSVFVIFLTGFDLC